MKKVKPKSTKISDEIEKRPEKGVIVINPILNPFVSE